MKRRVIKGEENRYRAMVIIVSMETMGTKSSIVAGMLNMANILTGKTKWTSKKVSTFRWRNPLLMKEVAREVFKNRKKIFEVEE